MVALGLPGLLLAGAAAWAQSNAPQGGASAAAASAPRAVDFIVAVVNSEPITNQDVRNRVALGCAGRSRQLVAGR